MLFDAKKYKFSKVVAGDLTTVLNSIKQMEGLIIQLEPFQQYKYVAKLISQFHESRDILQIQLESHIKVRNSKGIK